MAIGHHTPRDMNAGPSHARRVAATHRHINTDARRDIMVRRPTGRLGAPNVHRCVIALQQRQPRATQAWADVAPPQAAVAPMQRVRFY